MRAALRKMQCRMHHRAIRDVRFFATTISLRNTQLSHDAYNETVAREEASIGEAEDSYPSANNDGTCNVSAAMESIVGIVESSTVGPSFDDIGRLFQEVRNERELHRVVNEICGKHSLMHDVLNGHGFRVMFAARLSTTCARLGVVELWMDVLAMLRSFGFTLSRSFVLSILGTIRKYILQRFTKEGRNPKIVDVVVGRLRQLLRMCNSDRIRLDYVMYARIVYILTNLVAVFDRQNLYRSVWPEADLPRREGLINDWVVGIERCTDFDYAVSRCNHFLDELLDQIRGSMNVRPPFSFMARLTEYYFSTDNFEKMLSAMEDCRGMGINVDEITSSRMMQLACGFNIPETPQLLLEWRAAHKASAISSADVYRLLCFFCKSGGGKPCPKCKEKYNHRNVGLSVWESTPEEQRNCPLFAHAIKRKGLLEDLRNVPQSADWSNVAFEIFHFSRKRQLEWGPLEWRAFLQCCTFSPRVFEAVQTCIDSFPSPMWDDFLKAALIRIYRHQRPEEILPTFQKWKASGDHMSPITLNEALMGAINISDPKLRHATLSNLGDCMMQQEIYIMPYCRRVLTSRMKELEDAGEASTQEIHLVNRICKAVPRNSSKHELKDSCADIIPGQTRKHKVQYRGPPS